MYTPTSPSQRYASNDNAAALRIKACSPPSATADTGAPSAGTRSRDRRVRAAGGRSATDDRLPAYHATGNVMSVKRQALYLLC